MEKKYYSGWGVALGIVTQDMKDGNNNCCCLFATGDKFPAKNSVPAVVTSFRRNIVSAEGRITLVEFACSLQCMFFKVASNFYYDFLKFLRIKRLKSQKLDLKLGNTAKTNENTPKHT